MTHTKTSIMSAKEPATWFILEMTFAPEQACELYHSGALVRYSHGWRFYGDLALSAATSIEWIKVQIPATGMMAWAGQALKAKQYSICGSCQGCGTQYVPVWASNKQYGRETFCVECWHSFILERAIEGIYQPPEEYETNEEAQPM